MLRTLTFRIIWIRQLICQQSSLPLYTIHPKWLSLTNERKFVIVQWGNKMKFATAVTVTPITLFIIAIVLLWHGYFCYENSPLPQRVVGYVTAFTKRHYCYPQLRHCCYQTSLLLPPAASLLLPNVTTVTPQLRHCCYQTSLLLPPAASLLLPNVTTVTPSCVTAATKRHYCYPQLRHCCYQTSLLLPPAASLLLPNVTTVIPSRFTAVTKRHYTHGVRAFWILGVQFGSCGYIGILLVSK